jgi:CheY-like chemotaxis protein
MKSDPISALNADIEAVLQRRLKSQPKKADELSEMPLPAIPEAGPGRRRSILLVDDDSGCRRMLKFMLERQFYDVVETSDAKSALTRASREQPDLIILDFNMPGMNGYELLLEFRIRDELRHIPVIMISGAPNRQHLKTMSLDVWAFLEKPFDEGLLITSIRRALQAKGG